VNVAYSVNYNMAGCQRLGLRIIIIIIVIMIIINVKESFVLMFSIVVCCFIVQTLYVVSIDY